MSGSEDMIEIPVGERDRALREVMTLEREREALLVHIREQHQKVLRLTGCLNVACRERDEAREVGKNLHNQWFSAAFRSSMWRQAAKNYRRERNEARAEIERLTEALYEAGMQVGLLEREAEKRRGERR